MMMMICAGGCSGFLPLCHCFHPLPYILYVASGPTDGYINPIDDDDDDDGDEDDATSSYPPFFSSSQRARLERFHVSFKC